VDEPTAWLYQAKADWQAAERFARDEVETGHCHAIAKWQQTVEKAVKGMVFALHHAGISKTNFRLSHEIGPYLVGLTRLPRAAHHRAIQQLLHGLLDQQTRAAIMALDGLVPKRLPRRNTEYPFLDAYGQWTYPAADGVFSQEEFQQFRFLAHRVLDGASRIVSAIRRGPR
jgi:hypothetical protein